MTATTTKLLELNAITRKAFETAEAAHALEAKLRGELRAAIVAADQADWALEKACDALADHRRELGIKTTITL
jgi:hypothetical protein